MQELHAQEIGAETLAVSVEKKAPAGYVKDEEDQR